MAKEIDFIRLDDESKDISEYPYALEAYDAGKPTGGCRVKTKDDLKAMYQLWKETYGMFDFKYYFTKNGKPIDI
jgi:hypothetical protein